MVRLWVRERRLRATGEGDGWSGIDVVTCSGGVLHAAVAAGRAAQGRAVDGPAWAVVCHLSSTAMSGALGVGRDGFMAGWFEHRSSTVEGAGRVW